MAEPTDETLAPGAAAEPEQGGAAAEGATVSEWKTDKGGRRYRVHRAEGQRPRIEYGKSGDKPPRARKRKPAAAGSGERRQSVAKDAPTTAMIEQGLARLLSIPAIPFGIAAAAGGEHPDPGAVFLTDHFTDQSVNLARQLAAYSERNAQLRALLVSAITGEGIAQLAFALGMYLAPPLIYFLAPDNSPARRAVGAPSRQATAQPYPPAPAAVQPGVYAVPQPPGRVIIPEPPTSNGAGAPPQAAPPSAHMPDATEAGIEPVPPPEFMPPDYPGFPGGQSPQAPPGT